MSVWDRLVGQERASAELRRAVADAHRTAGPSELSSAMTHAWMIVGPPGSGRSNAAVAFATALVCPEAGCGQCRVCRDVTAGLHPDVTIVRPSGVIMGVDQTRGLVGRIGVMPTRSDWNVVVIEDADRLNEHADNALLKSLEEPPPHGVWVLCAPSLDDVLPTIRSRCRVVRLRTPPVDEVARFLQDSVGVDAAMASYAARASQGHIGRARALATDPEVRLRHQRVMAFPQRLGSVAQCMSAAAEAIHDAREQVAEESEPREAEEVAELLRAYGEGGTGAGSARARASSVLKDLEKEQRNRRRRMLRDELDRVLLDLLGLYRDVLAELCGADVDSVNSEAAVEIERLVARSNPATAMMHLDAIMHAREALAADGAEDLVFATLALQLGRGATVPVRSGHLGSERVP